MASKENLDILNEAKELLAQARATATLSDSDYKKKIDKLSYEIKVLQGKVNAAPVAVVEKEAGAEDEFSIGELSGSPTKGSRHPVFELLDNIVD